MCCIGFSGHFRTNDLHEIHSTLASFYKYGKEVCKQRYLKEEYSIHNIMNKNEFAATSNSQKLSA